MFKSWRSEKKKIKAVFRLQFQATQVPQLKKSALMISLVPEGAGKPTLRLEKVAVRDGTCSWENPVYETVKLIWQPKTGKFNEKIYHFIVSTGSSKSGFLGEASLDFADFATEIEPLTVCLLLKFANSGAVLHVTIQKIEGAINERDVEANGYLTIMQSRGLKEPQKYNNADGESLDFAEDECLNIITSQNPTSFQSPPRQNSLPQGGSVDAITTKNPRHRRSKTDWSVASASDGSLVDSNSPEDGLRIEWRKASDDSNEKLKNENAVLLRQVEVSELELQSLRKQILKESRRAQDLSKEINTLKEERYACREEYEQLKSKRNNVYEEEEYKQLRSENENLRNLLEEIRHELDYERDLNTDLHLQMQKTQDSNSELILAVKDLNGMLEQKNREVSCLSSIQTSTNIEAARENNCKCHIHEDEDQRIGEEMAEKHGGTKEEDSLKQEIADLFGEIEFHRKHNEELQMHIEQITRDYEVLKQENHHISSKLEENQLQEEMKRNNGLAESLATIKELESHIDRLEEKIKQQSQEYSESVVVNNELEREVKELKNQLEKQTQGHEDDLDAMIRAKTVQEQRAIRAEEALRKTRWKNAVTAERLQEEFKRLSAEMDLKFDENEKLTTEALAEANDLRMQKAILEQRLQKTSEELKLNKDQNRVKEEELMTQISLKQKDIEQMSLEVNNKSKQLEQAEKQEKEKHGALLMEIQSLRTEIEKLTREKCDFSKHAEQKEKWEDENQQMVRSIGKSEMPIQGWNKEKNDWEKNFASAIEEAKQAEEALDTLRHLKHEKDMIVENLQRDKEDLRARYNELQHSLTEEELENENLRKELLQLKNELQQKGYKSAGVNKKVKKDADADVNTTTRNKNHPVIPCDSKSVTSLKEKLRLLKEQIELREATSETSSNPLPIKGKNLSVMIEELENDMEQLKDGQNFCAENFEKGVLCNGIIAKGFAENNNVGENQMHFNMSAAEGVSIHKELRVAPFGRKLETCPEKEEKASASKSSDERNLTELSTEVACLKERNKSMESELKEMQERYSEISLKFAEVEGERQQLVMTVRNLKNTKKS